MLCRLWVANNMRFRLMSYQNITRVWDKKNSLYQLPRSGWSFDRAGLGATATYPAKVVREQN